MRNNSRRHGYTHDVCNIIATTYEQQQQRQGRLECINNTTIISTRTIVLMLCIIIEASVRAVDTLHSCLYSTADNDQREGRRIIFWSNIAQQQVSYHLTECPCHSQAERLAQNNDWVVKREDRDDRGEVEQRRLGNGECGQVQRLTVAAKCLHEMIISDYNRRNSHEK